jgi:hypothetical protein
MYIRTRAMATIASLSPDSVQLATPVPLKRMDDVIINMV